MREHQSLLGRMMPFGQKTPVEGTDLRLEDDAPCVGVVTLSRWNLVAEDPMSNARDQYTSVDSGSSESVRPGPIGHVSDSTTTKIRSGLGR